jgi:hypothetical protein
MWTKESIITSDRILTVFPNNYHKMDVFYTNGQPIVWRGRACRYPPKNETLIITGHSDHPVVDSIVGLYPRATWFGTNNQSTRAQGIPIGITNNTSESDIHPVYGNLDIMIEVASKSRTIRNLVYMNFVIGTYPTERQKVWDLFSEKPWVTMGRAIPTLDGRRTFLEDIRNHAFVLCPRGNGIDTHRLWETLYMGSIPVVRRDIAHSGWTDLPIVFVDSWEDVTEDFLQAEQKRIQSTEWNWNKLNVQYWIDKIRRVKNENWNYSNGFRF